MPLCQLMKQLCLFVVLLIRLLMYVFSPKQVTVEVLS